MGGPATPDEETRCGAADRRAWVVAACALVPYLLFAERFDHLCDDAYISFRYARHLAEGRGLIFNPAESPPVEGYTNFLWVVFLGLADRLGVGIELAARATSVLCGAALLVLVVRFVERRLRPGTHALLASAVFFAVLPPVAVWSTSGLETMPFALACFGAFERLCGDPARPRGVQAGLCAAAAALLRADGAAWAAAMIAVAAGSLIASRSRAVRPFLVAAGILAVVTAAHLLWRHSYYGEWVPNTARVKGEMTALRVSRGIRYVISAALVVTPLALVPALALWSRGRPSPALALQCGAVVACAFVAAVLVGGDFMPMGRFLVVAMPFLTLLLATVLAHAAGPDGSRTGRVSALGGTMIGLAVLADFDVHVVPRTVRERFDFRWGSREFLSELEVLRVQGDDAVRFSTLGRALALHTKPGESIIRPYVGAIGYETELHVYDVLGLVDREVSHLALPPTRGGPGHDRSVDPTFFFKYRPTYYSAAVTPVGAPASQGMPAGWESEAWASRAAIERHPLDVSQGFEPGLELRLLRLRWEP